MTLIASEHTGFERHDAPGEGLAASARLECGVCWWVYDPALGDALGKIPPGTAFSDLPGHWRCPACDAVQGKFMALDARTGAGRSDGAPRLAARVAALVKAFAKRDEGLRDLPIHNGLLSVEAAGFRAHGDEAVGVLITPLAMNLVILPLHAAALRPEGSKRLRHFPSGAYEFIAGRIAGAGGYEMCSLFSPMSAFADQAVVRETALAAADGLFAPPEEAPKPAPTRRSLFTGH